MADSCLTRTGGQHVGYRPAAQRRPVVLTEAARYGSAVPWSRAVISIPDWCPCSG